MTAGLRRALAHRATPFVTCAAFGLATSAIPPAPASASLLLAALALSAVLGAAGLAAARGRLPAHTPTAVAFGFLGVVALLREAQGGGASGYAALALLPLFWLALHAGPRALAACIAAQAALFIGPVVLVGGDSYPMTELRRALVMTAVGGLIGGSVQQLVRQVRRTGVAHRREHEFVEAVLGVAGSLVVVCDRSGRVERFNRSCELTSGRTFAQVRGRPIWELVPAGGRQAMREEFARLADGGAPRAAEHDWTGPDGAPRRIAWTYSTLLDDDGLPRHIIGTGLDVTDARATEQALARTDRRYREVLDAVRVVVFETDAEGRWTSLSPGWTEVTREPVATALGRSHAERIHPDDRGVLPAHLADLRETGRHALRCELRFVARDGSARWVAINARLETDARGVPTGASGTMVDVTERRSADDAVRRGARFLEALMETLDTGIAACDADGTPTYVNRASRELHGLDDGGAPAATGLGTAVVLEADGRTPVAPEQLPLARALRGERVRDSELVLAGPGGPPRTVAANAQAIHDVDGSRVGAVVALQDITVRKQLEADLRAVGDVARLVAARTDARRDVVEAIAELTGAGCALLYEPGGDDMLVPTAQAGVPDRAATALAAVGPSAVAACLRSGEPRLDTGAGDVPGAAAPATVCGAGSLLHLPVAAGGRVDGVLVLGWAAPVASASDRRVRLAQLLAREAASAVDRARRHRGLERAALVDALTGLSNRRAWDVALPSALGEAAATRRPVSVALMDLNAFKELNDTEGHAAGDQVLAACARAWREALRPTDVLARLGGDEFAAVLPGCDAEHALSVAEALRFATPHAPGAGVGIAEWRPGESPADLLARADGALYEDKARLRVDRLRAPERLASVRASLAGPATAELDALADVAARALEVPLVLVSLVDDDRQVFPGQCGLPEEAARTRQAPLTLALCPRVVALRTPLLIDDVRQDPAIRGAVALGPVDVLAYAGVPLMDADGHVRGALCAMSDVPRAWTADDVALLRGLVPTVMAHLEPPAGTRAPAGDLLLS